MQTLQYSQIKSISKLLIPVYVHSYCESSGYIVKPPIMTIEMELLWLQTYFNLHILVLMVNETDSLYMHVLATWILILAYLLIFGDHSTIESSSLFMFICRSPLYVLDMSPCQTHLLQYTLQTFSLFCESFHLSVVGFD